MLPLTQRFLSSLKKHPGGCFIAIVLMIISVATIKPQYYVLGWDNYSSYFNSGTNIFRTFFHVWRSYRGLGVASDSEGVDIFRQIFSLVLKIIFPEQLVDQLYIVMSLWIGTISVYMFGRKILRHLSHLDLGIEIASTVAAILYLCNLNTLAMFYFPIITYITRYAAIPIVFYLSYESIHHIRLSKKFIIFAIVGLLFISGSFITGTVFITTVMSLAAFFIFQGKWKRSGAVFLFFIAVNAFWLMPFLNYTKEKSSIIRLAPTFIDANESQLNKGKSFYDPLKQLILYPNFFETQYDSIASQKKEPFHPLATEFNQTHIQLLLFIFPILYILGSIGIIVFSKRGKVLLWVPLLIGGYLFLSFKEYSPLGFVYHWMDIYLPYFGVLFRFGDTKFHPYIAFAGSIASGVFLLIIFSGWKRVLHMRFNRLFIVPGLFLCGLILLPFWRYGTEGMLGFFMYVDLPKAYQQIASAINIDSQEGRVLHLPFDRDQYWKSYSWGGLGSAFFQYMVDKPLIDKTFEPASMENAYLHKRISDLTWGAQLLPVHEKERRANELLELFQKTGISYVVVDDTVSSYIPTKGIIFGGNYNTLDVKTLLQTLVADGKAVEKLKLPISLPVYPKNLTRGSIQTTFSQSLTLFTIASPVPSVSFIQKSTNVDSQYGNILEHESLPAEGIPIQSTKDYPSVVYPLRRDDGEMRIDGKTINYTFSLQSSAADGYRTITVPKTKERFITVTNILDGDDIVFKYYWVYLPSLNGTAYRLLVGQTRIPRKAFTSSGRTSSQLALSDWQTLGLDYQSSYRVVINGIILPFSLPSIGEQEIGTVTIQDPTINVAFLQKKEAKDIPLDRLQPTDRINCFGDGLSSYSSSVENKAGELLINSTNGSTCFWTDLSAYLEKIPYAELRTNVQASAENLDSTSITEFPSSGKPLLRKFITEQTKINTLRVCIAQGDGGDCFNKHQLINLPETKSELVIPVDQILRTHEQMSVIFALKPIGYQHQTLHMSAVNLDTYSIIKEDSISNYADPPTTVELPPLHQSVTLGIPMSISNNGYFGMSSTDLPYVSNKPCDGSGFRTFVTIHDHLVSYVENCYNELYTDLAFDSNTFIMWGFEYYLHSGKYPKLLLQDKLVRYRDKYASVYQGYPDISGFKNLQTPEYFFTSPEFIRLNLESVPLQTTSLLLPAIGEGDTRKKQFSLLSHAENEGVVSLGKIVIEEIPSVWRELSLGNDSVTHTYTVPSAVTEKTILPSFHVINFTPSPNGHEYLLRFNEGYDRQWMALGRGIDIIDHSRCDGFANCFAIRTESPSVVRMYLFYFPEILNFLGWGITAVIFFTAPFIFARKG